ncbi:hypothetical protein EON81_12110 [bacterium]|nr:MAG: hypothetical protein EON81_12110 [bacterium]
MKLVKASVALSLLSSLLLAGCGGSSDGSSNPPAVTTQMAFAASSTYNGLATPIQNPTIAATDTAGKTVVSMTASGRTVKVAFPATLAAGTYDLSAVDGVNVTYNESSRGGGGTWETVGGTLTVTEAGTNRWNLKLDNARFQVDGSIDGNPATGEFTMSGTAAGLPYTITIGPGGSGSFTVTNNTSGINPNFTPNYFLKSVAGGGVAALAVRLEGTVTTQSLGVAVPDEAKTNTVTPFTATSSVSFGSGTAAKSWQAQSGTIQVIKTGAKHKFVLANVVYKAEADTGATGGFTISGSFEK